MNKSKTDVLILMLMGIVIILMIGNIGLFIRMNQLQNTVLSKLESFQTMKITEGLEIGIKAPDFTLPDTNRQKVSLKDFAGKKILLEFSSIGCPPCKDLYPILNTFNSNHDDIQIVVISMGPAEENIKLKNEQEFDFPILESSETVSKDYEAPGTPYFYVIDEEGVIVNKGIANSIEVLNSLVKP